MAESTVSMKLLVDTSKVRRVLFAEASKECVDFLFNILSMPVATIIRVLHQQELVGSLPNLYKSLEALDDNYIIPGKNKDAFLKPEPALASASSAPLLSLTSAPQADKTFYRCTNCNSSNNNNNHAFGAFTVGVGGAGAHYNCNYVSDDPRATCPNGHGKLSVKMTYVVPPAVEVASGESGLVKGVVTYMVMDDLVIKPMSTISSIAMLSKFNIKDVGALEEKVVYLGMDEAIKLLKTSLQSKSVLTDVFC